MMEMGMDTESFDEKYRKFLPKIRQFRLMDDTFMSQVFQNKACTEFLIRTILDDDSLVVIQVDTQYSLKNLRGKSVRLDITAHDAAGRIYNIEVQRSDTGALPQRARYNSAMLDANAAQPGDRYEQLPETYVIFITENDYFHSGCPLYHVERMIRELARPFEDRAHILYVNGTYRGRDRIGALMHDFSCMDPKDMYSQILADEVAQYKSTEKGVSRMCRIMEELIDEGREEGRTETLLDNVRQMMKNGNLSLTQAMDLLGLDEDDRKFVAGHLDKIGRASCRERV